MDEGTSLLECLSDEAVVRLEDVCSRFEGSWLAGQRPQLEEFLAEAEGEEWLALLRELLLLDVYYRQRASEGPSREDYQTRFPEAATLLEEIFAPSASPNEPPLRETVDAPKPIGPGQLGLTTDDRIPSANGELTYSEPYGGTGNRNGIDKARPVVASEPVTVAESIASPLSPKTEIQWPSIPGYEILAELGKGGMGIVYKARDKHLGRVVALKMIRSGVEASADELQRFLTEAEAVARMQHPHIVQIFETGRHQELPFFSLEFVEGGSLAVKLGGRPLPPLEAAKLVEVLARGIHYAHLQGIVHRDLKPGNILLTNDGMPKITDFGLAKKLDDGSGQTRSGAIMGTPSYMAPEQAAGLIHAIGPATDVYALGAVLYELLTGGPPFRGATAYDTLAQVLQLDPLPPSQLQPKVVRDLETICLKCLQKEPAKRYTSAEALADDLDRYHKGEPILARRAGVLNRSLKYARRKPWVVGAWTAAVAALLLLVAGGGYYLYRRNLDLQAALAREHALDEARGRSTARISAAEETLKKRDWPGAAAAAKEALALVGDEARLADLKERAESLRATAENVQRFTDYHDRLIYHAVLAQEESDQPAHRQAALLAAREGLALFGLSNDGSLIPPRFGNTSLASDTEQWLTESCYEMYIFWADLASAAPAATPKEQRTRAREALNLLDRAAGLGITTKSYHLRRADLYNSLGEGAAAQQEQMRAATLTPVGPVDHFLLGMASNRVGKLEETKKHLKKVLEQEPDHFWANYYLAGCFLRMRPQHFERALAPLTTCIQLKPKFVWPYLLRGFVNGELNDFEAADADFAAADKLDLDMLARYGLLVNRAVVQMQQGMDQETRARVLRARDQVADAEREAKLIELCYDRAVADLEQAVELRSQQPQAYANLAELYLRRGRPEEALPQLNQAIKLAPTATLYRNRAGLHTKGANYEAALRDLEQAIRLTPSTQPQSAVAGDQLQRGRILFRLGKYKEALVAFDRTLTAAPDLVTAHQLRGETLLELERFAEAVAAMDKYQAKGTPSALASRARGLGRAKLGNYAGAIEDYTRALEIDRVEGKAADPPTLAYRGWAYLTQEAPKLALRDFDEALRLRGSHKADCYAGRGYAQVLLGQWRWAVEDAEAALKAEAPTARTQYNTARIYALAAVKVLGDPEVQMQRRLGQELRSQYQNQALQLLRSACEQTPLTKRAAFWKEYVKADPALVSLRGTDDYSQMSLDFGGAGN